MKKTIMAIRQLCVTALIAMIAGCASPKVYYRPAKDNDQSGAIKFKFAKSMIVFTSTRDKDSGVTNQYAITSVPVAPAADPKYSIEGADIWHNWFVETRLDVTYRENTDLIQQIGVAVTDKRVDTIKTVGSIATTAIGLAETGVAPPPDPPDPIDATALLSDTLPPGCTKVAAAQEIQCASGVWVVHITIGPAPNDSFPFSTLGNEYPTNSYLYTACREATVTLRYSGAASAAAYTGSYLDPSGNKKTVKVPLPTTSVMIADPTRLESLAFPAAGKVMAAASCGASSAADDAKLPSAMDYVDTLLSTTKSVKDAYDKAHPAPGPAPGH